MVYRKKSVVRKSRDRLPVRMSKAKARVSARKSKARVPIRRSKARAPIRKTSNKKKRPLNQFMKLLLKTKKAKGDSFEYNGNTYKAHPHRTLGLIYKKK